MSVYTDYILKWPFFMKLSRAALKQFELEELITFGGKKFQRGASFLREQIYLKYKKNNEK